MSLYQRPDKAITTPACNALRRAQMRALEASLVCAYVRPVPTKGPLGDLPAYAAFTQDDELRDRCREVRELLLKHDSRHDVSLDDVDAIDPAFAARLRAAGVTGEKRPLKKSAGKPLVAPSGKDEPAQEPADGLGFDDVRLLGVPVRRGRSSNHLLALGGAAALTSAAAATAYYLRQRKR